MYIKYTFNYHQQIIQIKIPLVKLNQIVNEIQVDIRKWGNYVYCKTYECQKTGKSFFSTSDIYAFHLSCKEYNLDYRLTNAS